MDGAADGVIPDSVRLVDYRRPRDRNLDLTPLLDVVFQLLIFFMVSSHFASPQSKLELPIGKPGLKPDDSQTVRVEVNAGGEIRVAGEVVADADFETVLQARMEERGVRRVQFHGDKTIDFGNFVNLMERAQEVGALGIEIVKNPVFEEEEP